jgi:hypothetical protein
VVHPAFLPYVDPTRLRPHVNQIIATAPADAQRWVAAWRTVAHQCGWEDTDGNAAGLDFAAAAAGVGLAERSAAGAAHWRTLWAAWPFGGDVVGRHDGEVSAVAVGTLGRRPIAVTGGADETVRVWDLGTGKQVGPPLRAGQDGGVTAVAVGTLAGRPIAVAGTVSGTVRVWDLA